MTRQLREFTYLPTRRKKLVCASLILTWILVPIFTDILKQPIGACSSCIPEVVQRHFSLFGYIMFGGFLVSFTQPAEVFGELTERRQQEIPWLTFRERVQFNTFLGATIFAGYYCLRAIFSDAADI